MWFGFGQSQNNSVVLIYPVDEKKYISSLQHGGHCVCGLERQKKMQVEQMKDGLEELKEKLRLTQSQLEAEREADAYRRQQVGLGQPQKTRNLLTCS